MEHLFVKNIIICAWDILLLFTINYTKRMQNKKNMTTGKTNCYTCTKGK